MNNQAYFRTTYNVMVRCPFSGHSADDPHSHKDVCASADRYVLKKGDEPVGSSPSGKLFRSYYRIVSVVPLAGNHPEVGAGDCSEVGNHVVAAVDVGKSLIEADVEHGELVVVAEESLQEGLISQ